jgi:choline dehydrogenase-like flavoprotein
MLVTNIPRALANGARLYANCRVERITRRGKRATGVVGRFTRPDGRPGPRLTVRAGVVIAACGAIQTPALLWRSGFRSPSGQLGRNLTLHPNAKVVALFGEDVYGWQGVHQAYQVRQFMNEGILITAINLPPSLLSLGLPHYGRALGELMQEYNRIVVAGCLVEDSVTGRVQVRPGVGPVVYYQTSPRDAARIVRGISLTAELMFAAGARRVILPFAGVPDLLQPSDLTDLQARTIPLDSIELLTVHLMGTARMSEDRLRGVVSSFGAFHDAEGLFVADAGLFPGPIGVNPMETILALVTRNAEWLVDHRRRYGI